ncbi:hypothetical protein JCM10212_001241 [Sporobolomyces blumeae]
MTAPRGNKFTAFAEDNFSRSGASGLYDRARPGYPEESIDKILSLLPTPGEASVSTGATIVELGAGTGIFTRGLLERAQATKPAGAISELIAVEPSKGMRQGFEDKVKSVGGTKVSIQDGLFDKIPVQDGKADLIVVAQAFHWVGHDGESAIRDMARVLKPDGVVALIWNYEDRDVPWVAQLRDLYEAYEGDTPQARHGYFKSTFKTDYYLSAYGPLDVLTYRRKIPTTTEGVVDRVLSKSYITALPQEKQEELAKGFRDVVKRGDGKVWIDEKEGTFEYPYKTELYLFRKK